MVAFDLQLPVDTKSPSRARHALDGMTDRIPGDVLERFQLAVTELVTNVIRHAELATTDAVRVLIKMFDDHLRVEVGNPGRSFRNVPRRPDPSREGGRGLLLIQQSTDRWGMKQTDGMQLWFEIDLPKTA
jgi:anti-sigma regulatory factor (Ser/Thr protein kinase)